LDEQLADSEWVHVTVSGIGAVPEELPASPAVNVLVVDEDDNSVHGHPER
jgi:hypothetical protein